MSLAHDDKRKISDCVEDPDAADETDGQDEQERGKTAVNQWNFPLAGRSCSRPVASSPTQRARRRQMRGAGGRFEIRASGDRAAEILLYGTIGDDWWDEGNTAKDFLKQLKDLGALDSIRLRINSGGGDVFDATAIYNILVKHEARVRVEIEGVAASAATLISMAGDEIHMSENAYFMVHNASGGVWGTAEDMRAYIELLEQVDDALLATYHARTNLPIGELKQLMDAETWMTAAEALEHGFVDAVDEAKKVTPHITPESFADSFPRSRLDPSRLEHAQIQTERLAAMAMPAATPPRQIQATTRDVRPPSPKEEFVMNKKLREKCVKAGMDPSFSDQQAQEWLADNFDKVNAQPADNVGNDGAAAAGESLTAESVATIVANTLEAREKRQKDAIAKFQHEVDNCLTLVFDEDEVPDELKAECYRLNSIEDVRARIQQARKKQDEDSRIPAARIRFADVQPQDRHRSDVGSALVLRCLNNARLKPETIERIFPQDQRGKDWEQFRNARPIDLARECLYMDGYRNLQGLSAMQIAIAALGWPHKVGLRADGGYAYHTTGTLSYLTQDAFNKSLLAGYAEAPATWRGPGRQAESTPDFKQIHRIKLSGAPNIPVWPDNTNPTQIALSNEEEAYAVEAYAEEISFSWRLLVNDDMDALSRTPAILGRAAGRTVNAHFWAEITANGNMADGVALFSTATSNRKRDNLITGSATPTTATVGVMRKLMRLMHGLNTPENEEGDDILNIQPRYIVAPAALEQTILQLVRSPADPADNKSSVVFNTAGSLVPVIEPLLDAASATAWYLFADPSDVDTVEVTFLQGQEEPFTNTWSDERTLSQFFTIVQTFAARRIDYRGMVRHDGA